MMGRETKSRLARRSALSLQGSDLVLRSTRKGRFCRNNANGILLGCRLRQHKWQKLKMAFRERALSDAGRRMLSDLDGKAASLSTIAGTVSAGAATVTLLVK